MPDLAFDNVAMDGQGLIAPVRRALRKLLRPILQRQAEVLGELARRLDAGERGQAALWDQAARLETQIHQTRSFTDQVNTKTDQINAKTDQINTKTDNLNDKLDRLNEKLEGVLLQFEALRQRHGELANEFTALVAMNWDHTALARRLAQLEDRLVLLGHDPRTTPDEIDPDPDADTDTDTDTLASIRFPGLDRYDPSARDRATPTGSSSELALELRSEPESRVG